MVGWMTHGEEEEEEEVAGEMITSLSHPSHVQAGADKH